MQKIDPGLLVQACLKHFSLGYFSACQRAFYLIVLILTGYYEFISIYRNLPCVMHSEMHLSFN